MTMPSRATPTFFKRGVRSKIVEAERFCCNVRFKSFAVTQWTLIAVLICSFIVKYHVELNLHDFFFFKINPSSIASRITRGVSAIGRSLAQTISQPSPSGTVGLRGANHGWLTYVSSPACRSSETPVSRLTWMKLPRSYVPEDAAYAWRYCLVAYMSSHRAISARTSLRTSGSPSSVDLAWNGWADYRLVISKVSPARSAGECWPGFAPHWPPAHPPTRGSCT